MRALFFIATLTLTQAANACTFTETNGIFNGDVEGKFISMPYAKRPLFELSKPLTYIHPNGSKFTAIRDYIVDGASIPRVFWSIIGGPFSGNHLQASVVHDYYTDTCQISAHPERGRVCQNKLEQFFDDELVHQNYYLGMLAAGVSDDTACAEFIAVSTYKTWDIDEDGRPTNILIFGRPINEVDAGFLKKSFGFVVASTKAVIKSRNTGDRRILNIFPDKEIPATPEGVQEHIKRLRDVLNSESYLQNSDALGLLTDEQVDSFDNLEPWQDDFLSSRQHPLTGRYTELTYLDPQLQLDPDSLAGSLGLKLQPMLTFPLPNDNTLDVDDLVNRQDELLRRFLLERGEIVQEQFGSDIWKLRPSQVTPWLEYEVTPQFRGYLGERSLEPSIGNHGTILLQDAPAGGQELFIFPSPSR